MLTVQNVSRIFDEGKAGFKSLSFSIQKGEIIGVLGTSGCGKSTLLRVISGLDTGYEGSISLSETISEQPTGMIFQEPRLMPWLSVEDNVRFGVGNSPKKENVQELLALVGLNGFEKHFPKSLSGGMAQRVAIARALIGEPDILLLDEPFSALDAFTKMQLQDLLLSIWNQRQTTMILVTHDIDEALYLCDRILVLNGQPGEIHTEITINKQKPRTRSDGELVQQKEQILKILGLK